MNLKVRFHAFGAHLYYKGDSCMQLFSSEFCRILRKTFFQNTTGRVLLTLYSTYLNQTKYIEVSFLFNFLYKQSKTRQKRRVALKLGNPTFVLQ